MRQNLSARRRPKCTSHKKRHHVARGASPNFCFFFANTNQKISAYARKDAYWQFSKLRELATTLENLSDATKRAQEQKI